MKKAKIFTLFSVPILRMTICALLIASANQVVTASEANSSQQSGATFATSAADGGRLVIRRSPLLGANVTISLSIDGKPGGTLVQSHVFDRYLTPGRHILMASPNSGSGWQGTLEVRPGETYTYSASYAVNRLVLTPVSGSR